MADTIDTGDHVHHGPSGEDWLVAYVRGDRLAACGWPDTMANLSDCTLIKKATPQERRELLESMAGSNGHRASYAQHALALEGAALVLSNFGRFRITTERGRAVVGFWPEHDPEKKT